MYNNQNDSADYLQALDTIDEKPNVDFAEVKPIPGGLQPIIAPKGQVQLNPVVVPVAFVPYATQSQPIIQLQPDKKEIAQPLPEVKDIPIERAPIREKQEFAPVEKSPEIVSEKEDKRAKKNKKAKKKNRIGGGFALVLSIAFIAFLFIPHFLTDSMPLVTGGPDVIDGWTALISDFSSFGMASIPLVLVTVAGLFVLINIILAIISMFTGRGFHYWVLSLLALIAVGVCTGLGAFTEILGTDVVAQNPLEDDTLLWLLTIIALFSFLFGLIFLPKKVKKNKKKK